MWKPWDVIYEACKYLVKEKQAQIFLETIESGSVFSQSLLSSGWSLNTTNTPLSITEHRTYILKLRIQHNYEVECWLYDDDFNIDKPCVIDAAANIQKIEGEKRLTARIMYILWLIYKQTLSMKMPDSYLKVDGSGNFVWQRLRQITRQF